MVMLIVAIVDDVFRTNQKLVKKRPVTFGRPVRVVVSHQSSVSFVVACPILYFLVTAFSHRHTVQHFLRTKNNQRRSRYYDHSASHFHHPRAEARCGTCVVDLSARGGNTIRQNMATVGSNSLTCWATYAAFPLRSHLRQGSFACP